MYSLPLTVITIPALSNLLKRSLLRRSLGLSVVALTLAYLSFAPAVQAALPPPAPDGGYPNNNTAEGTNALSGLTIGINNTAIGFKALISDTTGSNNTAVGVTALFHNVTGGSNTAVGVDALFFNTTEKNTAIGF